MRARVNPSTDLIPLFREYFSYDPDTGELYWRKSPSRNVRAGAKIVGLNKDGYVRVRFRGRKMTAHTVIWCMQTGEWPKETIDHANRVRTDNRWVNLRAATYSQNECNKPKQPGVVAKGVRMEGKRWRATIRYERKYYHLGMHDTVEQAKRAYAEAAMRLHGEFARLD